MKRLVNTKVMLLVIAGAVSAASAVEPKSRALIEQALNEPAAITLENVRLGDAITKISDQTGVPVRIDPESQNYLPFAAETMIEHVEIANLPLRQGLMELFGPLGMMFVVRDDHVEIVPRPALRCLGRRPTWVELDTLGWVSSIQPGVEADARKALIARAQMRLPIAGARDLLNNFLETVGPGGGEEVLTAACDVLGWAWRLDGEHIVITLKQEQVQRQLGRRVTLRMNNRPLIEVLQSLGDALGINIRTEPGAISSLQPTVQRSFSLNVSDRTGAEVLEMIAAFTGMGYYIEPDGVAFYSGSGPMRQADARSTASGAASSGPRPGGDPYVAKMVVPLSDGQSVEWLIRMSELPEDLQRMRAEDLATMIESMRARVHPPVNGN
jgi:hypothetical protein